MQENNNIFDESSGCIRQDALLEYLQGKLSGKERNLVEKHLLECEMCSDELEGLSNLSESERIVEIETELNSMVDKRTTPRILWLNPKVVYRVAAVAVLTIGVSTLLYYFVLKTTPSTMMSESQMPTVSTEMSDSITPLEVTSIPKDATERSESHKEESKLVERPAAPKIVANNMQIAEDVFIADSEIEVFDTDEKEAVLLAEKVITADSAAIVSTNAALAGQQADALRAANYEAKKEELATVSEGARLSKKAVVGFAQPMPTIENALKNYNQKNYRVALNEFNSLYSQGSITDTVVYYRAMCNY
ncbi:MAG TPA: zf-HC2 domain-containing protein, partial [Tenuifilaceae bacterium]|nr:zf-HC2 domain-containing protein [Tenuifilaceae bacterium]